jgi:hypothetical protein
MQPASYKFECFVEICDGDGPIARSLLFVPDVTAP